MVTQRIKRLQPGDRIRVIAPSGVVDPQALANGVDYLERVGYQVMHRDDIAATEGYLAGSDARRLEELEEAFGDPQCRAVFCARGGYGVTRLLPALKAELFQQHPKWLVGHSDITALSLFAWSSSAMPSLHGPHVAGALADGMGKRAGKVFWELLTGATPGDLPLTGEVVVAGQASGLLLGGNLTMLQTLAGLPWQPRFDDALFFLEEVNEAPYRIDRALTHLKQLGWFDKLRGAVIGKLGTGDAAWETDLVRRFFGHLEGPVVYGDHLGHHNDFLPLPIGATAHLNAAKTAGTLQLTVEPVAQ